MPTRNLKEFEVKTYDPRWFIWTLVFLLVSGVSLVSYILITTTNDDAQNFLVPIVHSSRAKATK